ncbi:MAG: Rne/Rng family ribonuclease [Mesorhizobium sp.]|nr:Rne/Rng family ribonuclease [Mesorhizobium sp.]MCO5163410.1 Rne/Rng family ribonuclease [Mesorhizobium sp.]
MPNKMLIDASHPEETRVVVTRGNRIEEFDFESRDKKQLRGNIYLARVTRVEPSLQAAFVEYGGNRHGFLAFSEIHPDYYQIPLADRQALLKADAEDAEADEAEEDDKKSRRRRGGKNRGRNSDQSRRGPELAAKADSEVEEADEPQPAAFEESQEAADDAFAAPEPEVSDASPVFDESSDPSEDPDEGKTMLAAIETESISESVEDAARNSESDADHSGDIEEISGAGNGEEDVESVGAEDALEELPSRAPRRPNRRQYKIQEVIKRRQILLVQVVKEERGNKGAALTTYLSLAGRYSVLMPNTARGGGISRKITSAVDRKRLKDLVEDLEVPQGMGVILRTAGANRTKAEIKRDYEYLMRMWENVRTLTLQSTAPALVYEEGSLIKRSVRDLYNKDIDEILVAGEDGYREAKDFMRMLMPSHAKVVQPYRDPIPMFARNGIEAQLDRMLQPQVTLKSGGYIIINQTEALVSIDVNSGRSTKEHSIEETALHTNLEAAEEVARQLRLRDLAGLIVIDFIDMEENRNNRAVEKRLKDHLKNDRARIQVGRISHFGLLEMSRQRIRASVLESTMKPCPHCGGTGHIRSDSSVALHVVRAIEEFLIKDARSHITVRTPAATALYVLNHKRRNLTELEERFGLTISMEADETLGNQLYAITRGAPVERPVVTTITELPVSAPVEEEDEIIDEVEAEDEGEEEPRQRPAHQVQGERRDGEADDGSRRKRRRRRRRRGGRDRDGEQAPRPADQTGLEAAPSDEGDEEEVDDTGDADEETVEAAVASTPAAVDGDGKKRRRGKRGGKRNRRDADEGAAEAVSSETEFAEEEGFVAPAPEPVVEEQPEVPAAVEAEPAVAAEAPAKRPRRAPRKAKAAAEAVAEAEVAVAAPAATEPEPAVATAEPEPSAEEQPARSSRRRVTAADLDQPVVPKVSSTVVEPAAEDKPKKGGWWQRKGFF